MADESYTIRPATADDADAVAEMWLEMTQEHIAHGWQEWELADDAVAKWRSRFLERFEKEEYFALVAVDAAGLAVGFLTARMLDPEPLFVAERYSIIGNLLVKNKHRRRGIGRCLTEAALETAKSRGAQNVSLSVLWANEAAIALYNGLGFQNTMRQLQKEL